MGLILLAWFFSDQPTSCFLTYPYASICSKFSNHHLTKKNTDFLLPPTKSPGLLTQKTQQKHLEQKKWVLLFFKADRNPEAEANQKNRRSREQKSGPHIGIDGFHDQGGTFKQPKTRRGRLDREMQKNTPENLMFSVGVCSVCFVLFFWGGRGGWKSHLKWNVRRCWISMECVRKVDRMEYSDVPLFCFIWCEA